MYFSFRGTTNTEMNVRIKQIAYPSKPTERHEFIDIPGRQEPLLNLLDGFTASSISATLVITNQTDISTVFQWISGTGQLFFSDQPDRYWNASACRIVTVKREGAANTIRELTVAFDLLPFAYAINNSPVTLSGTPSYFKTIGTYWSEPLIELTGSGDISVNVNGAVLTVPAVSGTIYIDVPAKKVYKLTEGYKTLLTSSGWIEDMILVPDAERYNVISWEGDVSAVKLTKNERWL